MALPLPPPPQKAESGDFAWVAWYNQLYQLLSTQGAVSWSLVDKAGSSLGDLQNKDHALLTNIQGGSAGERYHLTAAQYAALTAGPHNSLSGLQGGTAGEYYHLTTVQYNRATSVISKAGNPTTTDIASGQWAVYKNTSSGETRVWTNDAGTMKSTAAFT